MKAKKDPLEVGSTIGSIGALLIVVGGFVFYFMYRFEEQAPKDGIDAVFIVANGCCLLALAQIGWYGRRLMKLEREVEALRGKDRPE
jgi:hypothetical protein